LARATGSTFEEAKLYIEKYFKAHEAIRDYMDAQKIQAKTVGYVSTWYGRRRYLPEIESAMPQVRSQAERMAINMPIQGTEADILKLAMLEVERVIRAEKLPVKLLLQVHDELLFEVEEAQAASVAERLAKVMSGVVSMKVDFLVDTALSPDWGTME
jgi:DNA polymerase-1